LAARPIEAPISPVPRIASRVTAMSGRGGGVRPPVAAHQLGHAEGEVERLAGVQSRVAERRVVGGGVVLEYGLGAAGATGGLGAAGALGDIVAGELEVHAAGPDALLVTRLEEALDLVHDRIEAARLEARVREEDVRVHRVADPDDRLLGLLRRPQEGRQELA